MNEEDMMNAAVNEDAAFHERKAMAASEFTANNGELATQYGENRAVSDALVANLHETLSKYGLKIVEADA